MRFTIQKYESPRLHFVFQLEIGEGWHGWSFAKGPTLDPAIKRLAVALSEPEEGEGRDWDSGTYIPELEVEKGKLVRVEEAESLKVMREGLENGMLKFSLFGKKITGSFAFVKTKGFGPKNSWLLIKHKDASVQVGYDATEDSRT